MSPWMWTAPACNPRQRVALFAVGDKSRHRFAVLGKDQRLAGLCHLIHQLEALGLEFRMLLCSSSRLPYDHGRDYGNKR